MAVVSGSTETGPLLEFMLQLGRAYLACGEQTAVVESYLRQVAATRGLRRPRVVVFPTAVYIAVQDDAGEHVTLSEGATQRLRLDQIAAVYELGAEARRGGVSPRDGLERLETIARMRPRFGVAGVLVGHAVLTVGLSLVLLPTVANAVAAAALGLIVGLVKVANRDQPILSAPLSVVAATVVAALVLVAHSRGAPIDPIYAIVPPLVTFLPGAMLAFSLVELAYGDMVAGSARLITGIVQLVLLAFGLTVGALLVGMRPDSVLEGYRTIQVPLWASLAGVAVFGLGIFIHNSAPPGCLPWILLVLFAAFVGQQIAARTVGPEVAGFVGMLLATPLGNLIQNRFRGPPAMVTFLPAFWLLVPGALGLIGVKSLLGERAAIDGLVTIVFSFASIALGALVGESLYKWVARRLD
jgi:uncharacterized membrane protein YjjP (DUF1212 family)